MYYIGPNVYKPENSYCVNEDGGMVFLVCGKRINTALAIRKHM